MSAHATSEPRLGILGDPHASTLSFLIDLAQAAAAYPGFKIVVVGSTFDDLRLMASGPVYCIGPVPHAERLTVFEQYRLTHLLSLNDARTSQQSSIDYTPLPTAWLSSSVSAAIPHIDGGLILPAGMEVSAIAATIIEWMTPSRAVGHG
jgi:hypothetical protein